MKRTPQTITECCPTCHRDGWQRQEQFVLRTTEEDGGTVKPIHGAPPDAELCVATSGAYVYDAAKEGIALAKTLGRPVAFLFNETPIVVRADTSAEEAVRRWSGSRQADDPDRIWKSGADSRS